jgi:L-lactate dehydrogenase complex protein LldF
MSLHPQLDPTLAPPFPQAALPMLRNPQLRKNVAHATDVIQAKRAKLVAEKTDWQQLRSAASDLRAHALENLGFYLEQFESRCTAAGGQVHWASDAAEARQIILDLLKQENATEVIKIKTMTSAEIQLNPFLESAGVAVFETDLAELIIQLGEDEPSHIVAPALHVNRSQVREIFARRMGLPKNEAEALTDDPEALTAAARTYLRHKFLTVPTAISGANFLIAETGSVAVVESEGNGRMCLTLPRTMITLAGIEKVLPRFQDLEVMLQVLARSATGERMNPYTSLWTGITPGDGPENFHVVLLDNQRSAILARPNERQTLKCIRCGACMNTCPVYRQTGGHAYGSVYPGPIGAILTPQLMQMQHAQSLPYASSLCGACYEVCPVKINIPEVLIDLRAQVVDQERDQPARFFDLMYIGMKAANFIFARPWRFHASQRLARIGLRLFTRRDGWIHSLPSLGAKWTQTRDLRGLPKQTFREWYAARPTNSTSSPSLDPEEMPGAPSMHRHSGAWVGDRKSQPGNPSGETRPSVLSSSDPEPKPGAPSMHRHLGAWVGDRKSQSNKSKKEAQ